MIVLPLFSSAFILMDKPTNGLGPSGIHEIRNLVKFLPGLYDCTIMISSHMLSEIELMADDIGILNHGNLLFEGSLEELRHSAGQAGNGHKISEANLEFKGNAVKKMYMLPISVSGMYLCKFLILSAVFLAVSVVAGTVATRTMGVTETLPVLYLVKWCAGLFLTMLPEGVSTAWAGVNIACVAAGLILSIICVRSNESRSLVNIASTALND